MKINPVMFLNSESMIPLEVATFSARYVEETYRPITDEDLAKKKTWITIVLETN